MVTRVTVHVTLKITSMRTVYMTQSNLLNGTFNFRNSSMSVSTTPTQVNSTLPRGNTTSMITGSGMAYASSCLSVLASQASLVSAQRSFSYETRPYCVNITTTLLSTFTLCDGFARAIVTGDVSTEPVTRTVGANNGSVYTETTVTFLPASPVVLSISTYSKCGTTTIEWNVPVSTTVAPLPTPCSINTYDCGELIRSWSSSKWLDGKTGAITPQSHCRMQSAKTSFASCTLMIPDVRLVYWPVTTASEDLCRGSGMLHPFQSNVGID